jgi:hypothetical protein
VLQGLGISKCTSQEGTLETPNEQFATKPSNLDES